MNCQPSSTHSTSPSSHTRFVDANWKASADAALAPFWNRLLAIAIAAYEHEDEAAPSAVARASGPTPSPASAAWTRSRGIHACTIAEIRKPRTSAHQTSQAISSAFQSPSPIFSNTNSGVYARGYQRAASPSSRSTSTQSFHSPSRRPWRRWMPTSSNPAATCTARLAALSLKMRLVSL